MPRRAYHHGDLKRALLDAALALFEERGTLDFTMRELARQAGVTHNAPYRHFADWDALRTALGLEGFIGLGAAFDDASRKAGKDVRARVRLLGEAYVRYAVEHPSHFRLMFGMPRKSGPTDRELQAARAKSFGALLAAIEACREGGQLRPTFPVRRVALMAWSVVHGLASLYVSGELPFDESSLASQSRDFASLFFRGSLARRTALSTAARRRPGPRRTSQRPAKKQKFTGRQEDKKDC